MSFKEALEKLNSSKKYKSFKKKNPKAILFSAFFVLDKDFKEQTVQLDFLIPERQKVAIFSLESKVKCVVENFKSDSKKLDRNIKIDIKQLKEIIKKTTGPGIEKVIAILQKKETQFWNVLCFFNNFNLVRLWVDCFSGKILKQEQTSLFDFIKISRGRESNP